MTEHSYDPQRLARRIGIAALAVMALAACSSPSATSAGPSTSSVTVTVTPPSTPPPVTVTVNPPAAPPPVTVTVAPPAARYTGPGAFQSPSGNIHCDLSSSSAQCEVNDRTWSPPPKDAQCHLNWGSRIELKQGGGAIFDCYGQELPAADRTLGYGETWSDGAITCASDFTTGITCTDNGTGHYFAISRDVYRLG